MDATPRVLIIIASTRPGRVGLPVGRWFEGRARAHGGFEVDVADLAEIDLPFMDEPQHPRLGQYTHQHTRDWSARVAMADAFVFVMPEYNYGFNAPLKNALDYLFAEWMYKPLGFVSYGGVAAGTRAVQLLKPVVSALRMVALPDGVHIPFVRGFIDAERRFAATEAFEQQASGMLDELVAWERALRPRRSAAAPSP